MLKTAAVQAASLRSFPEHAHASGVWGELMILQQEQPQSVVLRAPRFPVEMLVRFRGAREPAWHKGRTENVSRTGVLLRCDLEMEIDAPVEMGFILPAEVLGRPGAEVECRGFVARVEPPARGRPEARVAVTISDYRFVREKKRAWAASR
ncbi:MAG: PilZ domain-containing protein [Terriglobia bacterium]